MTKKRKSPCMGPSRVNAEIRKEFVYLETSLDHAQIRKESPYKES